MTVRNAYVSSPIMIAMHDNYKDFPTITLAVGLNSWVVLHPVRGSIKVTIVHTKPSFRYFLEYEFPADVDVQEEDK